MTVSFVLRLVPGLATGEIAGEVEAVLSGEKAVVKDLAELAAFLTRGLSDQTGTADVVPTGENP